MEAKELRIGNLVYANYKGDLVSIVREIGAGAIELNFEMQPNLINGTICSPESLNGIPLNDEWLLKLGFRFHEPFDHYTKVVNDLWCEVKPDLKFTFVNMNGDDNVYMLLKTIKHVHSLQNLFFALTGEELTLQTDGSQK